ncbi:MAG: hypothetical protein ACKOD9_12770 [Rubrivivax sp.]
MQDTAPVPQHEQPTGLARAPTRRILVIVPFAMSAENLLLRQQQLAGLSFGPGIEFVYRPVKAGPVNYSSHHDFVLADAANFEAGCRAQDEGFDAVCIDTMSDSGVAALRSVLDIPVFGPGRGLRETRLTLCSPAAARPSAWLPACPAAGAAVGGSPRGCGSGPHPAGRAQSGSSPGRG